LQLHSGSPDDLGAGIGRHEGGEREQQQQSAHEGSSGLRVANGVR
jgi:hypothetical protein